MITSHLADIRLLPRASELLAPWAPRNVSVYPFGANWWPFNPSIHRDPADGTWRCLVRCANYTMSGGTPHLSPDARMGRTRTRNVLLELDEDTLAPVRVVEVGEPDHPYRNPACTSMGLEDLRLFRTARDGLVAVGCALQYNLEHPNRPEIVLCRLGRSPRASRVRDHGIEAIPVESVEPIRGPWGFRPQKNWVPFDATDRVRLLYSIERGVIMTDQGPAPGSPSPMPLTVNLPATVRVPPSGRSNAEVKLFNRPVAVTSAPTSAGDRHDELRGGSQLVALLDGRWLGVAHEMTVSWVGKNKLYWHTFYTVDASGRLLERSPAMRLSGDHGIEFAAGLAAGPDGRLAVSYGTDDHEAWVAVTRVEAVLSVLRPVAKSSRLESRVGA